MPRVEPKRSEKKTQREPFHDFEDLEAGLENMPRFSHGRSTAADIQSGCKAGVTSIIQIIIIIIYSLYYII